MKYKILFLGAAGAAILLGAVTVAARSYNPMKWIKKPTASQELAANSAEEKTLALQLQALLPARTTLKDACTLFKTWTIALLRFTPAATFRSNSTALNGI